MSEYLRNAKESDMLLLLQWANEAQVRKNSFSALEISYEEHRTWFHNFLLDENNRQYIYIRDDKPIGQIRISVNKNIAEIGYSICMTERNKGYGTKMLWELQERVANDFPEVDTFIGKVKIDNTVSKKTFVRAGFNEIYSVFELRIKQTQNQFKSETGKKEGADQHLRK